MTTNDQRAYRAWIAAWRYQTVYSDSDSNIDESTITGLLTDLQHLCDEQAIDFGICLEQSGINYDLEVGT